MIYLRPAKQRGAANFGWLDSNHSFSFGNYYDPKHMGVSVLRVINDDFVIAGAGFQEHGHRDMEIISYVLEGAIEHKDSMGNSFVVPAGDIQRMSAGTGITHSEFNHSKTEAMKFLQIWITPNKTGIKPSYEQKAVPQNGTLTPLVTADGREGSLMMHQDAAMYRLVLQPGENIALDSGERIGYLHIISGSLTVNSNQLIQGDAIGVKDEVLEALNTGNTELTALWFDLPRGNFPS
ncbi:MAG: pirin family protein [Thalassolituus sp.]|jgi:redox-sensitive bicupin YhaK (pirin superfamily)|uniref:pirin family protein n=1 Tax=Thalassolituus TaxID=187492 RepID=UPI000BD0493D|nr:pirin family protein [Thalassolituus oleivorans]PCI46968.1 MAG: pirin family protein [Oceanospirillales bacterium]PHQ83261.1 MAG: pirin family protein [Thalassobium sp.]